MKCLIEGYEYDIFISYRQKDNKYDGWVTEFVDNLRKELEATFKEEVNVYFDINPHDGLLETHDVEASLKDKLKCLIFIPIISKTYCDYKSFAWEHEFKTFAEQASKDKYGLMVRLPNGNVASRILPIRIHDITDCDVKLFEAITGNFLRGVEFIYKEPGVNRPLRSNEETPNSNLNHTSYRNQVNKVANAIQEVIMAIQHLEEKPEIFSNKDHYHKPVLRKNNRIKLIAGIFLAIVLIAAGISFSQKFFRSDRKVEKSIAVLPFYSMSADTMNQYLADGMMDAILTHLSKISEIRVMSRTSVEQYRKTIKTTTEIGNELGVAYILEGSFQQAGDSIRLIVQLIQTGNEGHVWSNIYDRPWNNVFSVQSEVAKKVASELRVALTPEEVEYMSDKPTENLEAYQAYLRGRYFTDQPHFMLQDWNQAVAAFQDAVKLDTTFALAYAELARAHAELIFLREDMTESRLEKAEAAASNALKYGSDQPRVQTAIGYYYLYAFRDMAQSLEHFDIAEKSHPNDFDVLSGKAEVFLTEGKWHDHVKLLEKALLINPQSVAILSDLAEYYWLTHRFTEAIDAANKAIALAPGDIWPYLYKTAAYWSSGRPDKETRNVLQTVGDTGEWYLWFWYFQEIGEGDLKTALQLADTTKDWGVDNKMFAVPRATLLATIYDYQGDRELALKNYKIAAEVLERKVAEIPQDPRYHGALGIAYAGLGRKDNAIDEGLKGVNLLPITKDALYGLSELIDLAIIYIMVDEFDLALEKLDQLLSLPSWITPAWLAWDIRFDPLKSYPAYKTLMTKYSAGKK